ncbi:MAG: tRNA (adenosine(37)-N6)-threonylcarbamoyltransferase complex dimerization subunit type 1 TsaB, partial [Acidimicrobiia bacterium]|nr:tRNA (adenosine(37)-N6)-threonylcarbamoyltransferase complex dimerization subunit type 1 TsaB [Acidimicrobiia bacterium]
EDGRVVASARRADRRGHVGFLVPALDFCFEQAGWRPDDVDVIAVDVGPGLFSGIRVGLSTAQGLAAALGVPLVPLNSLDIIALRAATHRRHIWSVVDVRRGELAVASYRAVPGGVVKDGPPQLVTVERFRAMLQSDPEDALVVGNWASLPEGFFRGLHRVKSGRPQFPAAEAMLELAVGRVEREDFPHADEVRPLYLREPDVTISWKNYREEGPWAPHPPA